MIASQHQIGIEGIYIAHGELKQSVAILRCISVCFFLNDFLHFLIYKLLKNFM